MPIYEYRCEGCHTQFEEMRRITEEGVPDCPRCGSGEVHKLISLSSFHLKGSGWYVTDYGGKKSGAAPGEESSGNGDSEDSNKQVEKKSEDGGSDKPESKTSDIKKPAGDGKAQPDSSAS